MRLLVVFILGFIFGNADRVVYISDVSRVEPEIVSVICSKPVDILIIDALYISKPHPTHFNLDESLEFIKLFF